MPQLLTVDYETKSQLPGHERRYTHRHMCLHIPKKRFVLDLLLMLGMILFQEKMTQTDTIIKNHSGCKGRILTFRKRILSLASVLQPIIASGELGRS